MQHKYKIKKRKREKKESCINHGIIRDGFYTFVSKWAHDILCQAFIVMARVVSKENHHDIEFYKNSKS